MKPIFLLSAIAGLGGALTLAAGAPAAAAVAPVSVTSCDYSGLDGTSLVPATAPILAGDLRITFVDNAPLAATNVRFAVSYDNVSQIIDDSGTFSSGVPITHDFAPSANLRYTGSAQCSVQSVTFSDGSRWQAG